MSLPAVCSNCNTPLEPGANAGICPACGQLADNPRTLGTAELADQSRAHGTADQAVQATQEFSHRAPELGSPDDHGPEPASAAPSSRLNIPGYELLREINRGGQGIVYQALQKSTKRKVAVKVLLDGSFASRASRRRFEREIELVASLKHPNIIAVFDSGVTADDHQYYVMDYVRGLPITQYVRQQQLSLDEALRLFNTVCSAVSHAHQRGIIHRDLKPSNILIDADGTPRILDFGLAKTLAGGQESVFSQTGQVLGTLPYMSPEQTSGNPDAVDTRSDVYSLGVILYEMLTGTSPYPVNGTLVNVIRHITSTQPTSLHRAWSAGDGIKSSSHRSNKCPLNHELETIVQKALAKPRERRYQSAGELSRDISNYLAGAPLDAKRDSTLYLLSKTLRKNKLPFSIAAAFFVLVAGAAVALSILYSRQGELLTQVQQEKATAQRAEEKATAAAAHETEQRLQAERESQLYRLAAARAAVEVKDYPTAQRALLEIVVPQELADDWRWTAWAFFHSSREVVTKYLVPWFPAEDRSYLLNSAGDTAGSKQYPMYLDVDRGRAIVAVATKIFTINLQSGKVAPLEISANQPLNFPGLTVSSILQLNLVRTGPLQLANEFHVEIVNGRPGGQILLFEGAKKLDTVTVTQSPSACAVSHDGKMVVVGFDTGRINLYSLGSTLTGAPALTPTVYIRGYREAIATLAFSKDDQQIHAISDGMMYRVWYWNPTPDVTVLPANDNTVRHIAFSPDGSLVATGGYDGRVKIFDVHSHALVHDIAAHIPTVDNFGTLTFFPDGQHLLTSGADAVDRIWDLSKSPAVQPEKNQSVFGWLGHQLGISGSKPITQADPSLSQFPVGSTSRGQLSPDGNTLFTTNGAAWRDNATPKLQQWDLHDLRHPRMVEEFDSTPGIYMAYNLRYLPAKQRLITVNTTAHGGGDRHKACQLFDTSTTPPTPLNILDDGDFNHRDMDVSPDDSLLALSTWEGTVSIWDWQHGRRLATLDVNPGQSSTNVVSSVRFHPKLPIVVAACHDSRVTMFSTQTYRKLATIDVDPERQLAYGTYGPLKEAVFSPDGNTLAIGAGNDLWLVDLSFFDSQIQQLAEQRDAAHEMGQAPVP